MKKWMIFIILLTLVSCKKNKIEKFYYPNKAEFLKLSKNNPKLEISYFNNFEKLMDTLEKLNNIDNKAVFTVKREKIEFNFISSTFFGKCFSAPRIKFFNILSISKDSIFKDDTFYPFNSLKMLLKKDLLNYGKDLNYSSSPNELIISITEKKEHLENLVLKIFKEFNKIQSETKDSLTLNINFNRRLEIFPPLPNPPPPLVSKTSGNKE